MAKKKKTWKKEMRKELKQTIREQQKLMKRPVNRSEVISDQSKTS